MRNIVRPETVEAEIAALAHLDTQDLRIFWRDLTGKNIGPGVKGELLRAVVAHRLQELAFGKLPLVAEKRLAATAREVERERRARASAASETRTAPSPSRRIKPGSRLIRSWQGPVHEVVVLSDGYMWDGHVFTSLSAIARAITGTSWNGWTFFGVERSRHASQTKGVPRRKQAEARGDLVCTQMTP